MFNHNRITISLVEPQSSARLTRGRSSQKSQLIKEASHRAESPITTRYEHRYINKFTAF